MSRRSYIDYKRAAHNSEITTNGESIGKKLLHNDVNERVKHLRSNSKHTLLKLGVGAYALSVTHAQHELKACGKKSEKLKKLRKHLDDANAIAGQPWSNTDYFFNVAGAAFERKMIEIKEERLKKKHDKYRKRVERSQKLGAAIASGAYMLNDISRTLSMKRVMDSPSGSTTGIDKEKLAVGIMHDDDDIKRGGMLQQSAKDDGPSV